MFKRHLLSVAMALSMVATASLPAQAYRKSGIPERGFLPQTSYMAERGRVSAPFGHIEFCVRRPSECLIRSRNVARARLDANSWRVLKQVNYRVNRRIRSKSDRAAFGKTDYWTIGGRVGDCEDYALTKRHELIRRGWSSNTLLVATARDRRNRMHAVLIVHTNRGDFVLDNQTGRIRSWTETGYTWLKRQSRQNPKKWVRLSGRPMITGAIPARPGRKARKGRKAVKASPLALLAEIRNGKRTAALKKRASKNPKAIRFSTLPPLPARNISRHAQKRMAMLTARLKEVQKRLAALRKDEERIARQLKMLKATPKALPVNKVVKTERAAKAEKTAKAETSRPDSQKTSGKRINSTKTASKHRSTGKVVTKRKKAGKSFKKRRAAKRVTPRPSSTKALTLLRKLRKARRHKPQRPYKRRWTQNIYSEYYYSI